MRCVGSAERPRRISSGHPPARNLTSVSVGSRLMTLGTRREISPTKSPARPLRTSCRSSRHVESGVEQRLGRAQPARGQRSREPGFKPALSTGYCRPVGTRCRSRRRLGAGGSRIDGGDSRGDCQRGARGLKAFRRLSRRIMVRIADRGVLVDAGSQIGLARGFDGRAGYRFRGRERRCGCRRYRGYSCGHGLTSLGRSGGHLQRPHFVVAVASPSMRRCCSIEGARGFSRWRLFADRTI
jgi:hypothetical protein